MWGRLLAMICAAISVATANLAAAHHSFAIYDMEHTGWTLETIRMLLACSRSAESGAE